MIGSIQQARFVVTNANNLEFRELELLRYYVNHRNPLQCIGWQWNVLVLPLLITRINRKNHRFVPWLMFVKINFVWMRIIRVPRETDFACYLIKPRRNCFQVNSAFNFGVCEHIAPCFNFSKVKCEIWILTSILKSSQLMNIITRGKFPGPFAGCLATSRSTVNFLCLSATFFFVCNSHTIAVYMATLARWQDAFLAAWQSQPVDQQRFACVSLPPSSSSCATAAGLRSTWQESQLW